MRRGWTIAGGVALALALGWVGWRLGTGRVEREGAPVVRPTEPPATSGVPAASTLLSQPRGTNVLEAPGRPEVSAPTAHSNDHAGVVSPASVGTAPSGEAGTASIDESRVAWFRDTTIPLERRLGEIARLGRMRDADSTKTLMALGEAQIYVNRYAVEALGGSPGPRVREYLQQKLADSDALLACAAIRALGRSADDAAVAMLAQALVNNRGRPDGHDELVCTAAVETLGLTASGKAESPLIAELKRSEIPGWSLEYGTAVVLALSKVGGAAGRQEMGAYADRLAARSPADPMAKASYDRKIIEARVAASAPEARAKSGP